jgi:hypothetical protein
VKGEDSVAAKAEGTHIPYPSAIKTQTELIEGSKATELLSSAVGGKRKRGHFTEDEMHMLINMSNVVNNVASALRETSPAHVDADLCLAVMEMTGLSEEALIVPLPARCMATEGVKALCLVLVISDNAQVLIMCLRLYVAKDN